MKLLRRSSRRHFARHPAQLALAVLGVAIGVAVVLGIDLANASAARAFALATESVVGRATHHIAGGPRGVDEQLYRALRIDLRLRACAPQVAGVVRLHAGDQRHTVTLLGIDPLAEAELRPWLAFRGDAELPLGPLLVEPGAVLMTARAAARLGIEDDAQFTLEAHGVRHPAHLVGQVTPRDPEIARGLDATILADLATAQEVLGLVGRLTRIDVALDETAAGAAHRTAIERILPADAALEPAAARRGALRDLTRAFRLNLQALSLLALMIGGFLIYNAIQFAVVQRRAEFGTLRALGSTRRQLLGIVLVEAAVLGAVGTGIGLMLGPLLGQTLVGLVAQTINDLYFTVAVTGVAMPPLAFGKALALGLVVCTVSALPPALEAARVQPREAMLRTDLERRFRRRLPRVFGWAAACAAGGVGLLTLSSKSLLAAYGGLFFLLLGMACLVPFATLALLRAAQPVLRALFGTAGSLAARGAAATLRRTAVATAALMLAVAASVGLGVMIGSFRVSVATWLRGALGADIYVTVPAALSGRNQALLDPELVTRLRRADGVRAAATYRRFAAAVEVDGVVWLDTQLVALQTPPAILATFQLVAGDAAQLAAGLHTPGGAMISEPLAYRLDLGVGDEFGVRTDRGPRQLRVVAVFRDFGSERGVAMIDRDVTYTRWWQDPGVSSLALFAAAGCDPDALAARLRDDAAATQVIQAQSSRGLQEASLAVFDRTFAITGALRLLCMAVAFLGIWSALLALQLDRRREIGVLRALGATPRQVATLVWAQCGLLGACAGLIALPVGALLGWLLITVINRRSFGWTLLDMHLPVGVALAALATAVAAALLAGAYPAWKFARTHTVAAMREDG